MAHKSQSPSYNYTSTYSPPAYPQAPKMMLKRVSTKLKTRTITSK